MRRVYDCILKMRSTLLVIIAAAVTNAQSTCNLADIYDSTTFSIPATCTSINLQSDDAITVLADLLNALVGNDFVTQLTLAQSFTDDEIIALANTLPNSAITSLRLWKCYIGDPGAIALATVINESSLEVLYLSKNNIGDAGATALATALETQASSVLILSLKKNQIGDAGAIVLANMLKTNTVLQILNLDHQSALLTSCAAIAFAHALNENSVLFTLNFDTNKIGKAGLDALKGVRTTVAIGSLTKPVVITLSNNPIEECNSTAPIKCDSLQAGKECGNQLVVALAATCDEEWDEDECIPNCAGECGNGVCVGGTCACTAGWEGTTCESNIDDCLGKNCGNGSCKDGVNTHTCECKAGWNGADCTNNIGTTDAPTTDAPATNVTTSTSITKTSPKSIEEVRSSFDTLDTDNDGLLNLKESGLSDEDFKRYDTNSDRFLSRAEVFPKPKKKTLKWVLVGSGSAVVTALGMFGFWKWYKSRELIGTNNGMSF
jgi:hypothetical protein